MRLCMVFGTIYGTLAARVLESFPHHHHLMLVLASQVFKLPIITLDQGKC